MNDSQTSPSQDTVVLDLNLADNDLLTLVGKPLRDSKAYWDKTKNLETVRKNNMALWLPNHWQGKDVYDYQEGYLYQDPRVFLSIETVCSVLNARVPMPEVMPASDSIISLQLAKDVNDACTAHSKRYQVQDIFRIGTRNLMLKRIGYIKLRWDPNRGKNGDIVPEFVDPADVVVDMDARWGDVPRFQAQLIRNKTAEELLAMFPEADFPNAKAAVAKAIGSNRFDNKGNAVLYASMLGKKLNIWEVWFRYFDAATESYGSGLAFLSENLDIVFGKTRNPNWNYDDENNSKEYSNFLDFPAPPFIPINYLNDGSSYVDLTSMAEQAAALQSVVDRRGFQVMENSEQSGSGLIFNTQMITKADIAKLTGSPDERIGVKGDVRAAVTRIPPPPLPQWVLEDRMDSRNEIMDIFAVHDITLGRSLSSRTLGAEVLQQQQDYTRMDDIARAIERAATQYYRYLVQMMKVYYTEDHWFQVTGEDGQFDHVLMRHDLIEDGIDIAVEAGSMLPVNKKAQSDFVGNLAKLGMIDPLTMYEVGAGNPLPSPKKMLERFITWKTNPQAFIGQVQEDDFDRKAFMDIQILMRGEMPKKRDEITPAYLKFFNNFMLSGKFEEEPELVKHLFAQWLNIVQAQAQAALAKAMTQAPTQEELDTAAQNQPGVPGMPGAMPPGQPGQPPAGPAGQVIPQQAPPAPPAGPPTRSPLAARMLASKALM